MDKRINKSEFSSEDNFLWNKKTIDVFRYYMQICKEYNLKWYCGCGTVIGAIRHKGMIPWDDDIDVCMPREEYDKFIEICRKLESNDFELVTPDSDSSYNAFHARLMDKNSTILFWRRYPVVLGIYIDIFPMDGIGSDKKKAEEHYRKYLKNYFCFRECHAHFSLENIKYYLTHNQKKRAFSSILFSFNRKWFRDYYLRQIKKIAKTYSWNESKYILTYSPGWGEKEIYLKEWVEETTLTEFEGMQVPVPAKYDEYLRYFYNDYMKLPPVEERNQRHKIDYYNLNRRETFEEILQHIKEQGR